MDTKRTIVFDLGGVLIDWNERYLFEKIFVNDAPAMEHFLANICTRDWNAQQDAGRSFEDGIRELVAQHPQHEPNIRAYFERWEEMIKGDITATVQILVALKRAGYPLFALSNWSAETFPAMRKRFEFLQLFETIVLSGEVGTAKPGAEIYEIFLKTVNRDATDCLFIDDMKDNINTAKEKGFQTIHFESPEQLRDELKRMGISL